MQFTKTFLTVIAALALAACGDVEPKPGNVATNVTTNNLTTNNGSNTTTNNTTSSTCLLDTDCLADEVCEAEVCVAVCLNDADCSVGEVCGPRLNGPDNVCQPEQPNNVNPELCDQQTDPDLYCEAEFGEGATCDTATGQCMRPAVNEVTTILIQDITTDQDACFSGDDPGSDIQGVELQDSVGNTLGWAEIVADGVVETGNNEVNLSILDGTAPSLNESGCVDTFSGNVVALGCTGYVGLRFLDASGNPIVLSGDEFISVYEYGLQCGTGSSADEYTVFTCSDSAAVVGAGDVSSCNNVLGTASGLVNLAVEF